MKEDGRAGRGVGAGAALPQSSARVHGAWPGGSPSPDQHGPLASSRTSRPQWLSSAPPGLRQTDSDAPRHLRPLSPATRSPVPHRLTYVPLLSPAAFSFRRSPSRHRRSLPSALSSLHLCFIPTPALPAPPVIFIPPCCHPSPPPLQPLQPLASPLLPCTLSPVISVLQSPVPTSCHLQCPSVTCSPSITCVLPSCHLSRSPTLVPFPCLHTPHLLLSPPASPSSSPEVIPHLLMEVGG